MNPQEKETRPDNREEHRKTKTDKPSRLGKEAKIGAAVILVLLAVFVAAIVVKLARWNSDDHEPAEIAHRDGDRHKGPDFGKEDHLFSGFKSNPAAGHAPKVVTPAAAATKRLGISTAIPTGGRCPRKRAKGSGS